MATDEPHRNPAQHHEGLIREVAKLFGKLFIGNRQAYAFHSGTQWVSKREPYKMGDFRQHLLGKRCLGAYLLDGDSNVRMMAFDIDLMKQGPYFQITDSDDPDASGETDLVVQYGGLEASLHRPTNPAHRWSASLVRSTVTFLQREIHAQLGLTSTPIVTGGGAHVLVPFGEALPAAEARSMAHAVMDGLPIFSRKNENFYTNNVDSNQSSLEIEIFPKQDTVLEGQLGNLIRLPFGWHEFGVRTYALDQRPMILPSWGLNKVSSIDALRLQAECLDLDWEKTAP